MSCPYKHYLSYVENLKTRVPARPLTFGKDFHKLLQFRNDKQALKESFESIKDTYYDMPSRFQTELGENYIEDLKTIFNDYRKVWKNSDEPIKTEYEFMIELGKFAGEPVVFHGLIDEVYEGNVMGEHKTFSRQPSMDILAMNTQACLYAKAWEFETGEKFERVQWDYIKSNPAAYPVWLEKSGRFSEAKNNNITHLSWARACKEKGITDKETIKKGLAYEQNIANFFFRCGIELMPHMVDSVWDDFKIVIKDVVRNGEKNKVKNITRDCSWCNFRPICYAEFTGADVNYVKNTDFEVRERSEPDELPETSQTDS